MNEIRLYCFSSDALLRPLQDGSWVISNPRVRRHVQVDGATIAAIMSLSKKASEEDWLKALSNAKGWRRTVFSNTDGLLEDPTGLGESAGKMMTGAELFSALREAWIVMSQDGKDYDDFLAPLTSILDRSHLGTFHQLVGRSRIIHGHRQDNWEWWHEQKFMSDGKEIRPNLYRWIQGHFFHKYFGSMDLEGLSVLDFACGNGYFSHQFQLKGAKVVGIDTSEKLISIARDYHGRTIKFLCPRNDEEELAMLSDLPDENFDIIYLSDVLLFFFHDFQTGGERTDLLYSLLRQLRRLLKPTGMLYLMEPNGVFSLASRIGWSPRMTAIITEYREQIYNIAPTTDRIINALSETGFMVSQLIHPEISREAEEYDPQAYAFAKAFPIWDFYCCRPVTEPSPR